MGVGFTYFMGKNEINYGLEVLGFKTDFDFYNPSNRHISQAESTTEIGGYVKYKFVSKKKKLLLEPSFQAVIHFVFTHKISKSNTHIETFDGTGFKRIALRF